MFRMPRTGVRGGWLASRDPISLWCLVLIDGLLWAQHSAPCHMSLGSDRWTLRTCCGSARSWFIPGHPPSWAGSHVPRIRGRAIGLKIFSSVFSDPYSSGDQVSWLCMFCLGEMGCKGSGARLIFPGSWSHCKVNKASISSFLERHCLTWKCKLRGLIW